MANRQTTFLLKRSNVPGKIPPSSGLTLGELALNTADAILYTSGTTQNQILPIGWDRIHRTGDTVTGDFNFFGTIQISGSPLNLSLSVTGDTSINGGFSADTITIINTPTLNNNLTQILGRNSVSGDIQYREINSLGNSYTYVSGSSYSALTTDNVLGVDSLITATTIYLPDSIISGRLRYDIKDIGLNSSNNNITIISSGSDTIISTENSNNVVLSSDGGALIIFNTGNGTWLQM